MVKLCRLCWAPRHVGDSRKTTFILSLGQALLAFLSLGLRWIGLARLPLLLSFVQGTAGFFLSSLYCTMYICSLECLAQVALFKSATTAKERIPNPDSSIRSNTKFKCYITVIMLTLSRQRVTILTFVFKNFLPAYFSTDISTYKFYTREPYQSAVSSRKHSQFIFYTTYFRSDYVHKRSFCGKKAVHCSYI